MKIIRKLTIFVVTCLAIFACYFSFEKNDVKAWYTNDYEFECLSTISLTDDFNVTFDITPSLKKTLKERKNVNTTPVSVTIYVSYPSFVSSGNMTTITDSYEIVVSETKTVTVKISAPLMAETILISTGSELTGNYTEIYNGSFLSLITNQRNGSSSNSFINLCNEVILYGKNVANYFNFETTAYSLAITAETQSTYVDQMNAVTSSTLSKFNLTFGSENSFFEMIGLNFECSNNCKVRIYFKKTEEIDLSSLAIMINSTIECTFKEDDNGRLYIELPINISDLASTEYELIICKTNTAIYQCSFYGSTYSYLILKKYEDDTTGTKSTLKSICQLVYLLGVSADNYANIIKSGEE